MELVECNSDCGRCRVCQTGRTSIVRACPPDAPVIDGLVFVNKYQGVPGSVGGNRPFPLVTVREGANNNSVLVLERDALTAVVEATCPRTEDPHRGRNGRVGSPRRGRVG